MCFIEYSCFTMLCYFLLYDEVNQLYVYIYPLPSWASLPLHPLFHPSGTSQSTELSSLCCAEDAPGYAPTYMSVPACPTLPSHPVPTCPLSMPALEIGSSVPFFCLCVSVVCLLYPYERVSVCEWVCSWICMDVYICVCVPVYTRCMLRGKKLPNTGSQAAAAGAGGCMDTVRVSGVICLSSPGSAVGPSGSKTTPWHFCPLVLSPPLPPARLLSRRQRG